MTRQSPQEPPSQADDRDSGSAHGRAVAARTRKHAEAFTAPVMQPAAARPALPVTKLESLLRQAPSQAGRTDDEPQIRVTVTCQWCERVTGMIIRVAGTGL